MPVLYLHLTLIMKVAIPPLSVNIWIAPRYFKPHILMYTFSSLLLYSSFARADTQQFQLLWLIFFLDYSNYEYCMGAVRDLVGFNVRSDLLTPASSIRPDCFPMFRLSPKFLTYCRATLVQLNGPGMNKSPITELLVLLCIIYQSSHPVRTPTNHPS